MADGGRRYSATVTGNPIPEGITKIKITFYLGLEEFPSFEIYGNVSNGVIACTESGVTWFKATWVGNNQYSVQYVDSFGDGAPTRIYIGDTITEISEDFRNAVMEVSASGIVGISQSYDYDPSNDDTLPELPSGYVWQIGTSATYDYCLLNNITHEPLKFGEIAEMLKNRALLIENGYNYINPIDWYCEEGEGFCEVDVDFIQVISLPDNIEIKRCGITVEAVPV